jgi:hypothetical protein
MSANNAICVKRLKTGYAVWHELNPDKPKMPKKAKRIVNEDNAMWYAIGLCDGLGIVEYGIMYVE